MKKETINIFATDKIIFDNLVNKIDYFYDIQSNFLLISNLKEFIFNQNQLNIFFIPSDYKNSYCLKINKIIRNVNPVNTIVCIDKSMNKIFTNYQNLFYLPVSFTELIKKINYIKLSSSINFKNLQLNRLNMELINNNNNNKVTLTQIESNIISILMRSNKKVSREILNSNALGYAKGIDSHSLDSHIYRLRKKLLKISKNNLISVINSGLYQLT